MVQSIEQTLSSAEIVIPTVAGVECVYLPSVDVYRAAQWYMRVFGMQCSSNTPLQPDTDMSHVILNDPGHSAAVFLIACESGWSLPRRKDGEIWWNFCFEVADINATLNHLLANNVRMESDTIWDRGVCGLNLRCYDLDNNKIEIFQQPINN